MSLKAVVDTDIIVSRAIKPQGMVGVVLQRLRQRDYLLLLSRETLDEVVEVLHRPCLRRKYQLNPRSVQATLRLIVLRSELVEPDVKVACVNRRVKGTAAVWGGDYSRWRRERMPGRAWHGWASAPVPIGCCAAMDFSRLMTRPDGGQRRPGRARLGICRCLHRLLGRCGAQGRMDCVLLLRCGVGVAEGMRG